MLLSYISSSIPSKYATWNTSPRQISRTVPTKVTIQNSITTTLSAVPTTLKNPDSNSLPIWMVLMQNTPNGNVVAHQPILNGMGQTRITVANAKTSQRSPKPQNPRATIRPII